MSGAMVDVQALGPGMGIPWNTTGQLFRSDRGTRVPGLSVAGARGLLPTCDQALVSCRGAVPGSRHL
ncbi:hypothetical protein [Streptomyces mirabilis]|uniref:hypothetical protein n=1 Tax=Streptomyces mirabilis TaxID=68239 RepID=UPI00332CC33B